MELDWNYVKRTSTTVTGYASFGAQPDPGRALAKHPLQLASPLN